MSLRSGGSRLPFVDCPYVVCFCGWPFYSPGGRYVRSLASNVLDFKICLIRLWKPCFCFRLMEFGRILLFPVSVFLCSSFVVFFCMISLCINCEVYPLVGRIFFFITFLLLFPEI